jgi:hypothetical protein
VNEHRALNADGFVGMLGVFILASLLPPEQDIGDEIRYQCVVVE